jgi:hypothetical protein
VFWQIPKGKWTHHLCLNKEWTRTKEQKHGQEQKKKTWSRTKENNN